MKQITIELDDAHYKRSHYKRYYTEEEFKKIKKAKTISQAKTWREFLLYCSELAIKEERKQE